MEFTKMHGAGNDYVYVDCFEQSVSDPASLARTISNRNFGVGGDGLVLILPSDQADVRMRMFNADGSEGEMCGNAVRCVGKYVHDHGRSRRNPLTVETPAGIMTLQLQLNADGLVSGATVDMGKPILPPAEIPTTLAATKDGAVVDAPITAAGETFEVTCVSMGNPHAVTYVPDASAVPLAEWGPAIETHEAFPNRVNAHFVQVHSPEEVTMVVWERGSGPTLACGTGASAVCVAGVLTGRGGRGITAHLPGGDLTLEWREHDGHVLMTGPAEEVYTGTWPHGR
ncbi:MAG: diaminopimelate epimerase [Phycisphaerae bacterium]